MKHFYFDQGGMFGNPKAVISDELLVSEPDDENHITDYYYGHMEEAAIYWVIDAFNRLYPKQKVIPKTVAGKVLWRHASSEGTQDIETGQGSLIHLTAQLRIEQALERCLMFIDHFAPEAAACEPFIGFRKLISTPPPQENASHGS